MYEEDGAHQIVDGLDTNRLDLEFESLYHRERTCTDGLNNHTLISVKGYIIQREVGLFLLRLSREEEDIVYGAYSTHGGHRQGLFT